MEAQTYSLETTLVVNDLPKEIDSLDMTHMNMHSNDLDGQLIIHDHQGESEFRWEGRLLFPTMEKSTLAIIAILAIIVFLILVLLLTAKLEMRCLTRNNGQWDLNYDDGRGGGKDDGNIEERISYIRSIIQTVVSYFRLLLFVISSPYAVNIVMSFTNPFIIAVA